MQRNCQLQTAKRLLQQFLLSFMSFQRITTVTKRPKKNHRKFSQKDSNVKVRIANYLLLWALFWVVWWLQPHLWCAYSQWGYWNWLGNTSERSWKELCVNTGWNLDHNLLFSMVAIIPILYLEVDVKAFFLDFLSMNNILGNHFSILQRNLNPVKFNSWLWNLNHPIFKECRLGKKA